MTLYSTIITFGGVSLTIIDSGLIKTALPKLKKVIEIDIPDRDVEGYRGTIIGVFYGTNRDTDRTSLEALNDGNKYALIDGIHNGDYRIVTGTLNWLDSENTIGVNKFEMEIIQDA